MSTILNTIKDAIAPESSLRIPIINVDDDNENLYDKLDDKFKKAVDKITVEKHKKQAIKKFADINVDDKNKQYLYNNINNVELENIYSKLNSKQKKFVDDELSIVDKYLFLQEKQRKAKLIGPTEKKKILNYH